MNNILHLTIVAGARPNFIKIAPIIRAIEKQESSIAIDYRLVHTGQHYDEKMSGSFFKDLDIPNPHSNLNCSKGTQAEQTAYILVAFEKELLNHPTDLVIVVGDVNSTLACAITTKKLNIPLAHVEAGLRSGDLSMPEEINRLATDSISDYLFTTTKEASSTLLADGKNSNKVFFVGNVMIDTLLRRKKHHVAPTWFKTNFKEKEYILLTMHRPSNVDAQNKLQTYLHSIIEYSNGDKIIFPVHPRTKKQIKNIEEYKDKIYFTEPLGYLNFMYLLSNARAVITDSGGITEEATVLNVPCLTLRDSTERPETISLGTNLLIGTKPQELREPLERIRNKEWKTTTIPDLWDGNAATRIIDRIIQLKKEGKI